MTVKCILEVNDAVKDKSDLTRFLVLWILGLLTRPCSSHGLTGLQASKLIQKCKYIYDLEWPLELGLKRMCK